jgi:hypothetical protein
MEYLQVLYLNSAKATYKDLANGTATFTFDPPLNYPAGLRLKLATQQFSFTNFFINVSASLGNNVFTYTHLAITHTVTIPDGSYSVSELSSAINLGLVNNGDTNGAIILTPDYSTNKVQFVLMKDYSIDFPAGSPYLLNGCVLDQHIPSGGGLALVDGYSELAPNVAQYNNITNLYLHTNLTNNSCFSGKQSNIIASIIPTASVGSIQNTEPYNLVFVDCHELSGATVNSVILTITDQNDVPVNLTENFSATLLVATMTGKV